MERRLAAILAADVVGYSRMMAEDETGTFERVTALHQEILAVIISEKHGRVVKVMGDGVLAEFGSVVDAVEAAVEIQAAMERQNLVSAPGTKIELRIGVNMGDLIVEEDDIYGEGVNIVARLEPLARPGGICITREVFEYTRGKVGQEFEPAGLHHVKNVPEPIAVFRSVDPSASPGAVPGRRRKPAFVVAGFAALGILLACFAVLLNGLDWELGKNGAVSEGVVELRPALVVLPFENLGLSGEESYLADGLTDDLITDFSKVSGLMVIGSNTAFSYKGRKPDYRSLGRELGVRYVLDGSMRRSGGRILVNVRLTDLQSSETLWAERFERNASEIFAVQDEVIQTTVARLGVDVSSTEQQRIGRLPSRNLEAYDYYLRAEEAARSGFRPGLGEALALYTKATALDPTFARAYAARSRAEALIMRRNYDDVLAYPVARKLAYEHASLALELDPEAALPFAVLSELQTVDGRYEEALRSAQLAVDLAPGEAAAQLALSFAHTFAGRHEDAIRKFEIARRLNPQLPAYARQVASLSYILDGQPEKAIEILEEIRSSSEGVEDFFNILGAAYAKAGQMEQARAATDESERIGPHAAAELYRVLFAHFRRQEDLERILEAMELAGLQKWPFDFQPGTRPQLAGAEIAELMNGELWRGNFEGRGPGLIQISKNGTMALRSPIMFATGSAQVRGNELCLKQPGLALRRAQCGPVYGEGHVEGLPYSFVNAHLLFHFVPDG